MVMRTRQQSPHPNKQQKVVHWYYVALVVAIILVFGTTVWLLRNSIFQALKRLGIIYLFSIVWIRWTLIMLVGLFAIYLLILLVRKLNIPWTVILHRPLAYLIIACTALLLGSLIGIVVWILSILGDVPTFWSSIPYALFTGFGFILILLTLLLTYLSLSASRKSPLSTGTLSTSTSLHSPVEPSPPPLIPEQPLSDNKSGNNSNQKILSEPEPLPLIAETAQATQDSQVAQKIFFVSYCDCEPDKEWAKWIERELKEASYSTILRSWNVRTNAGFLKGMKDTIRKADFTMIVLSSRYLKALETCPGWAGIFEHEDQVGKRPLLFSVLIDDCRNQLKGVLKLIPPIDLFGLDETTARKKLLDEVHRVLRDGQSNAWQSFPG